jgi:glucokinase
MPLLAGDIGGTKVDLALFEERPEGLHRLRAQTFSSAAYTGLAGMLSDFLGNEPPTLQAAAFGVAGPVHAGRAQITNLPWTIDAVDLRARLETDAVAVINDLEAMAWGVLTLIESDLLVLNEGAGGDRGTRAVIAAGTGLGEAVLFWDGEEYHAAPSEGGHTEFGPRNSLEVDLLAFLADRFGHVSYERIVSGSGLVNIYEFLRDTRHHAEQEKIRDRFEREDAAAVISETALRGDDALCEAALHLFAGIYGAEAGNLALKSLATGGVYVAGGIAPKIRAKLVDGTFMEAFLDKGRMRNLVQRMPVRLVLQERTAIQGAANCAARLAHRTWSRPAPKKAT